MNIALHEFLSIKKNKLLEFEALYKIERYCHKNLGNSITDILLNEDSYKYQQIIIEILEKYGYDFNSFYTDLLVNLATKRKESNPNTSFLINEVIKESDDILINTAHGNIKAKMLAETLNDRYLTYKKQASELVGHCHELTMHFMEINKFSSVTAFCTDEFCADIIHSYNIGEDGNVYDVSHNLIMPTDEYIRLFNPCILNKVSYEELIITEEYKKFLKGFATKYPLYALARKRAKEIKKV